MSQSPTDPTIRAFVTAINNGDRGAFDATLAADASMSDDGTEQVIATWAETEIFSARGRMEVESEQDDGRTLIATFTNSTWGTMRTRWQFIIEGGKITRFETGQA